MMAVMKIRNVSCVALVALTIVLLFAMTIARYYNRAWSIESQNLAEENDRLRLDWQRMQLEYSAHKTQSHVESIVWNELKMKPLEEKDVYRIRIDE